jgi:anti-sigma regulatory factor (Ser/Thr protein kinase)
MEAWNRDLDELIAERLRSYRKGRLAASGEADSEPSLYALDLPSRTDALLPLSAFVLAAARRAGMSPRDTVFVEVAIYEACLNVIEHAYHFDPSRRFRVDLVEEADRMTFRIVDNGEPLDPAVLADRGEIDGDTRRAGRGLGFRIIGRAMDAVAYETGEGGENCLTLCKYLREAPIRG